SDPLHGHGTSSVSTIQYENVSPFASAIKSSVLCGKVRIPMKSHGRSERMPRVNSNMMSPRAWATCPYRKLHLGRLGLGF
ncbi:MAG: hypothetical protein WAN51_13115, partial [Alphaproteobacteria bacterium]